MVCRYWYDQYQAGRIGKFFSSPWPAIFEYHSLFWNSSTFFLDRENLFALWWSYQSTLNQGNPFCGSDFGIDGKIRRAGARRGAGEGD
jgi:hypothetical protein